MKLTLRQQITQFVHVLQTALFPVLEEELGELTEPAKRLVAALEMIPLARFVPSSRGWIGRPSKDRLAIASAFVAKAVYGFGLTRQLLDALRRDPQLRRICGWKEAWQVPHEATFSRAFSEFARMELPQFVHEALIRQTQTGRLIGHIARDSTAIEARERYPETPAQAAARKAARKASQPRGRRGAKKGARGPHQRWKGGKPPYVPKPDTRLQRQRTMKLPEMLADLPQQCDLGGKKNSQGNHVHWRGYKLHLDVADGQIPISAVLTSASVHDSQVAIPLATMSTQRVTYCYELMDAAYDAHHITEQSRELGHVPIVDPPERGGRGESFLATPSRELSWAQQERYKERTMVERINARIKDEFGGRNIRVRGAAKVMAHLMFGVLALTVERSSQFSWRVPQVGHSSSKKIRPIPATTYRHSPSTAFHPRRTVEAGESMLDERVESAPARKPADPRALNAYRHGLTGQIHILTPADQVAYDQHCRGFHQSFAPVGAVETDLAQAIADDRWRLNRAGGIESSIFALGSGQSGQATAGNPEVDVALAQARVWLSEGKNLQLLSLYQHRRRKRVTTS